MSILPITPSKIGSTPSEGAAPGKLRLIALWGVIALALAALAIGCIVGVVAFQQASGASGPVLPASIRYLLDPQPQADHSVDAIPLSALETGESGLNPDKRFWTLVSFDSEAVTKDLKVEIAKLRAVDAMFWISISDSGSGSASASAGPKWQALKWEHAKGGISIAIPNGLNGHLKVAGNVAPVSVNRPVATVAGPKTRHAAALGFERSGGAVFGALLMLAGFSAIIATLNKEPTFLYFAAWLISILRVAAISRGWDATWVGFAMSPRSLAVFSNMTLATTSLFTVALFQSLFSRELVPLRAHKTLDRLKLFFLVFTFVSAVLPASLFHPILWTSGVLTMVWMLTLISRVVIQHSSATAIWYALSWATTLVGLIIEVLTASGLLKPGLMTMSVDAGVIATAALTAVALAARMRSDREERLTAQKNETNALSLLRQTYDLVPSGLFSLSPNGQIEKHNPAFDALFAVDSQARSTLPKWDDLFGAGAHKRLIAACLASDPAKLEFFTHQSDGSMRAFGIQAVIQDQRIEGSANELTAQKRAEDKLRFLADHDPLTGLLNRRGLDARLLLASKEVAAGRPMSLAYIDLDRFKLVNDLFGHATGDRVLSLVANRLTKALSNDDFVARVGGDEFVLLLWDQTVALAGETATKLLKELTIEPYQVDEKAFSIDASIGISPFTNEMTAEDAVAFADNVCSQAKKAGGSRVLVQNASSENLREHRAEIELAAGLRSQLQTSRFFTVFQPIVALSAGYSKLNYEVLLRLRDDSGRTVFPGKFIASAERHGMMSLVDRWVIERTLTWLEAHPEQLERIGYLTLNLSGSSLNDERFVNDIHSMVRAHSAAANKMCFEITESVALCDLQNTRKFVDRVKSHGSMVALDDFGAGYTSFSYLKEIPADFVKIDGTFIRDINKDPSNYAITRAIVDLTHELGMESIAEWAEDIPTVRSLVELRVDYGQGYGIGRPVEPDAIALAADPLELLDSADIRKLLSEFSNQETRNYSSKRVARRERETSIG